MKKLPIHQPKVENVSVTKLQCLKWLERILTCLLIITGVHILEFYFWSIFHPNATETIAVKYAIYIAIGSFFYLFVYNQAIGDKWGAKDVPPFEHKRQIKISKKN